MGKHQILQNCSLSLRLNVIFEITNGIGQQLCPKCCFFCSNSVLKSLFLRLDQPVRMRSPERIRALTVSIATGTSNGSWRWLYRLVIGSFIQKAGHIKSCIFPHSKLYKWDFLSDNKDRYLIVYFITLFLSASVDCNYNIFKKLFHKMSQKSLLHITKKMIPQFLSI